MEKFSYLSNGEISSIEVLYQQYLKDNSSVDHGWQKFFEGFEFSRKNYEETSEIPESVRKEFNVISLINGYRSRGHLFTLTNPVRERRKYSPTLDIENFDLSQLTAKTKALKDAKKTDADIDKDKDISGLRDRLGAIDAELVNFIKVQK